MPDTMRAALIFPVGFVALVILVFVGIFAFTRLAGFVLVNLLALTMRPGKRYDGWRWDQIRRYVYDRDNHECQAPNCHASYRMLNCHHKRPVSEGGGYWTWNLETLCFRCHARRHPENPHMER